MQARRKSIAAKLNGRQRCRAHFMRNVFVEAEADVLTHTTFPAAHRLQIHSTNSLERLNA
jgi:transposase-like protein